jgi:transcriptional regulator with XRE-family HTH domain
MHFVANDAIFSGCYGAPMLSEIHKTKQPRRPHFIEAWAEARNFSQADLARELGADKSIVSRWYDGSSPSREYQERLAALFHCEPDSIFRHPDDDWMARFSNSVSSARVAFSRRSGALTRGRQRPQDIQVEHGVSPS